MVLHVVIPLRVLFSLYGIVFVSRRMNSVQHLWLKFSTCLMAPLTVISSSVSSFLVGSMIVLPYMKPDMQHALNILNLAAGSTSLFFQNVFS